MIVLVDDCALVKSGYAQGFQNAGVVALTLDADEFRGWVGTAAEEDLDVVDAIVLGSFEGRQAMPKIIRQRTDAPVIAMNDGGGLGQTLEMFEAGADDVVRKPAHVKEILARVAAMVRRQVANDPSIESAGDIVVFFDGRAPKVNGEEFVLPRREQRILEHLAKNLGKRVTKKNLFDAVYGIFNEKIDESVIESHTCKLRKKLRSKLGYDPIDAKRYLGYRLEVKHQPGAS